MDGILDRLFPASPVMGLLGDENMLQQARQQGLLGLAAGLLQAGGPSRTRTNIGQAIGSGLLSGQQMYQQAVNQQIQQAGAMQKLQEAQRQRQQQQLVSQLLPQVMTTERQQALTTGAQAPDPLAALIGAAERGTLDRPTVNQAALSALSGALGGDPDKLKKVMDAIKTQVEIGTPPEQKTITLGEGQRAYAIGPGGQATQIAAGGPKAETIPADIRSAAYELGFGTATNLTPEQYQQASRLAQTKAIERAAAGRATTTIDMTGGQKGFENETNLRKEFQNLPETKAFGEMKAAYGQVLEGLNKANAVGDLAAATKIMKLLDPGSVVRESELAMAMQAGGLMDRVANYATNIMQGTKLSPAQRKDFADLAQSLFSVSFDAFGEKRNQYRNLADQYGFNVNRVVGPEPDLPKPKANAALDLQKAAKAEIERRRKGQ